jgi:large subunit ribosomal protein L29
MKEIREMSQKERGQKLMDLRAELVRMRTLVESGGSVEDPSKIREIRRTIARILTVINQETKGVKEK